MGKFNDCELDQTFQNNKNAEVNVPVTVNQTTKWISKGNKKADNDLNECCEFKKVELVGKKTGSQSNIQTASNHIVKEILML